MAVPTAPPPTQTAQGMPDRGDTSNLVAGPAAPSTAQTQPPSQGGSGATLVAQQQARDQERQSSDPAQQDAAINRMIQGGQYDPTDAYVQQKIAGIDKQLEPLQQYRSGLEAQMAQVEASTMNPADKEKLCR